MLWLVGLYPIWVLAAVQAFKFLISILEHGDVMEKRSLGTVKAMLQIA